jgi:glycosyltransferase 2 family protein
MTSLLRLAGRALAVVRSRPARICFALVAVGLALWAVGSRWSEVLAAGRRLDPLTLLAAVALTVLNVVAVGLGWWTALADLGSRLPLGPAARIFYLGQLGKYVPGSVWPLVAQAELGRDHQVPRRRTATATFLSMLLGLTTALVLVIALLPVSPGVLPAGFGWVAVLVLPLLVVLHPRVLALGVNRALRLLRREPLERPTTLPGTLRAAGWNLVSWAAAGLQVFVLAVGLGAPADPSTAALAVGGYALAWAVGFVVVIAPAGAGAREVALAAVLSPVLDGGAVVLLVLVSRVLFTVCDLSFAGAAMAAERRAARPRPLG